MGDVQSKAPSLQSLPIPPPPKTAPPDTAPVAAAPALATVMGSVPTWPKAGSPKLAPEILKQQEVGALDLRYFRAD